MLLWQQGGYGPLFMRSTASIHESKEAPSFKLVISWLACGRVSLFAGLSSWRIGSEEEEIVKMNNKAVHSPKVVQKRVKRGHFVKKSLQLLPVLEKEDGKPHNTLT